jgi:hypothetical protein
MNTPRQPNARPGMAPFLGQSHNAIAQQAPPTSFTTPFSPESTPAPAETARSILHRTRRSLTEQSPAEARGTHN